MRIDPVTSNFENLIKNAISISNYNYNLLRQNNSKITMNYIIDNGGNSVESSFRVKNDHVSLSSQEVESILTESLSHKFSLSNKPSSLSSTNFYALINIPFIIK